MRTSRRGIKSNRRNIRHGNEELVDTSLLLDRQYPEKAKIWSHYLRFGGYPALIDAALDDDERQDWLKNYVRTYLEQDIRDIASFRDLEPFIKLQHYLARQTASLVNYQSMATHCRYCVHRKMGDHPAHPAVRCQSGSPAKSPLAGSPFLNEGSFDTQKGDHPARPPHPPYDTSLRSQILPLTNL